MTATRASEFGVSDLDVGGFDAPVRRPRAAPIRRARIAGMATAGLICLVYLVYRPPSIDYASGDFRARLFHQGAFVWNNLWFGGHPLPGYGVVSPMISAVFGVVPVAVASVLLGTWCFILLAEGWAAAHPELPDPVITVILFACGCGVNLWAGRLTFTPAVAFGVACLLARQRDHRRLAVLLAALCGLSSPVGALSLAVVLSALWLADSGSRRHTFFVAAAAVIPIGMLIVLFPEGGWYPFTGGSFFLLCVALAVIGWCGRDIKVVRWTVGVYALVAIAAFVVKSPLGGNVVRLGWLASGPAGAVVIRRHRRTLLPAFAAFSLIWGWAYVSMSIQRSTPTASAAYYESLASYINALPGEQRVEVVPTDTYLQADVLAIEINIARGWETQIDRELNPEFYGNQLTDANFHLWLQQHAVQYVAVPLVGVHDKSIDEVAIINARPSYLRQVWADSKWKLYRVLDPLPLADNNATVIDVQPESLTIDARSVGTSIVRFRFTRLYSVTSGDACVSANPDGWIALDVRQPGVIQLDISVSNSLSIGSGPTCNTKVNSDSNGSTPDP